MNFITTCFTEYDSALSELLKGAGFTADQTRKFLPNAASGIVDSFQCKDIEEIISAFGSKEPTQLIGSINVIAIAKKVDMNPDQVTSGFEAIAPVISQAFMHNSDGMVGAAISIAWQSKRDYISSVKRLFS